MASFTLYSPEPDLVVDLKIKRETQRQSERERERGREEESEPAHAEGKRGRKTANFHKTVQ